MKKYSVHVENISTSDDARRLEERLQAAPGVITAKCNTENGKIVVMYDEKIVQEKTLLKTLRAAGMTVQSEPTNTSHMCESCGKVHAPGKMSLRMTFLLGFFMSLAIFSVTANVVLLSTLKQIYTSGALTKTAQQNTNTNVNADQLISDTVESFTITGDNHIRGDINAPITLVEFSDFQCPYCEDHYPTMQKLLEDYAGKVRLVYKHFPLTSIHPQAQKAAEASECASEQGKFWEMHDKMFANQADLSIDNMKKWAGEIGLNTSSFTSCLDTGKYAGKVKSDQDEGSQKGVQGTPATFLNGRLISGALPYGTFKQFIDDELKKVQ